MKHKKWLAEFNTDWGRNVTWRMVAFEPVNREEAENRAEEIKGQFGDPDLESKVVSVEPIEL